MGRGRPVATARSVTLFVGVALVSACGDSPSAIKNFAVEHAAASRPAPIIGARIRYDRDRRPVVTASDGSRRRIASMLSLPRKMGFGDYAWNDRASPGAPVWIRVDLARQLMSVFRGPDEIGATVIIYGTDGKDTPSGVFPVRGRERMHRSVSYDADMPFTLWLTNDGVAIHASSVERGRATHGCIGVPPGFAEKLFDVVRRGDTVIVLPAPATA